MKKILIILQLLIFSYFPLIAQTTVSVAVQSNSSIIINGTSNLLSFKLSQNGDKLLKKSFIITATQNQNKITLSQNLHSISVKSFNSTNKMALRDFFTLVKADTFPTFQVQLNYIETIPKVPNNVYSKGKALVYITITGITKQYMISVSSEKKGGIYIFNGVEKINIRDFGLTPPVKMMGLIKVSEWINIEFNIVCKITPISHHLN